MKIEKKKVSSDSRWSSATKAGLASLMGMAVCTTFSACGVAETDPPESWEDSSDSNNIPLGKSSSSQLASSSQEASSQSSSSDFYPPLAGVTAPETSSSTEPPTPASSSQVVVDIPKSSSSFSDEVLSSITEAAQSSALNPTNSAFEPLSSSVIPESSSSESASSSSDKQILQPNTSTSTWQPDTNSYIHLCPDGTGMCMQQSMVTTFEFTDVDV